MSPAIAPRPKPRTSAWTGGQYSLYRALFGAYLFAHYAQLAPWGPELFSNRGLVPDAAASPLLHLFPNALALWDSPAAVAALIAAAAVAALCFAVGFWDRCAAAALWYAGACLYGRNPLIANPALPFVGWLLLAHLAVPPAPYGSWSARGRSDPGGGWQLPRGLHCAAWWLMSVGYSYSGLTQLASLSWRDGSALARVLASPLARPGPLRDALLAAPEPLLRVATWSALGLEAGFVVLALARPLRPLLWSALLALQVALAALVDCADLSAAMLMVHLFSFDPAWLPGRRPPGRSLLFYDGDCGLCHRTVRFVLAEDPDGTRFEFAPLASEAFEAAIPAEQRRSLPDSIALVAPDGSLLTRSSAVLAILRALGGYWRALAALGCCIPTPLRDAAYDFIASIRHRLFTPPPAACPLLPPALRSRFRF